MTFARSLLGLVLGCALLATLGCADLSDPKELPVTTDAGDGDGDGDAAVDAGDGDTSVVDAGEDASMHECDDVDDCEPTEGCVLNQCQPMQLALKRLTSCIINRSGHLVCWGDDDGHGLTYPPPGEYSRVAIGEHSACAIRASDSRPVCWGESLGEVPNEKLRAIDVGARHACGLRETYSSIVCWGPELDEVISDVPDGRFSEISVGRSRACAISESGDDDEIGGELECWGSSTFRIGEVSSSLDECVSTCTAPAAGCTGAYDDAGVGPGESWCEAAYPHLPDPPVHALDINGERTCLLDYDDRAFCFGAPRAHVLPNDHARKVSVSVRGAVCGLLEAATIECWGDEQAGSLDAPTSGPIVLVDHYTDVAAGLGFACAIRTDGKVECDAAGTGLGDQIDELVVPARSQCPNAEGEDADLDGVVDVCDNCPADANADQSDSDGDYLGDVCDSLSYEPVTLGGEGESASAKLAAADLDGDATSDAVFGWEVGLFYRSSETGTFEPISETFNTSDIAFGDHDRDGDLDVIASSPDEGVAIFSNPLIGGADVWERTGLEPVIAEASSVALGDFDGDGDLDVVAGSAAFESPTKGIWLWDNGASSSEGVNIEADPTDRVSDVMGLETADINGDGNVDLVSISNHVLALWWDNSEEDGTMMEKRLVSVEATNADHLFVADLDGKGRPEIIISAARDNYGHLAYLRHEDGEGDDWVRTRLDLEHVGSSTTADIDGNGAVDIVACTKGIAIAYLNDMHANFTAVVLDRNESECMNVLAAELDGPSDDNGRLDVLFSSYSMGPRLLTDTP